MKLIIVSGSTSTGKTAIARRLADKHKIAIFIKDAYKERLFDTLPKPPGLLRWQAIETASWRWLYDAVEDAQKADTDLIIEGNFQGPQREAIRRIIRPGNDIREVYCYADGKTIYERYTRRNRSGERHSGHRDHLWYWIVWIEARLIDRGIRWVRPLGLSDKLLRVDTSDFSKIDQKAIEKFIEAI